MLYERHWQGMARLAERMLGSPTEAEDAVQHAFTAAYRQIDAGFTPDRPRAWLYAITRNRCLTIVRDRREVPGETPEVVSTVGVAEQAESRSDLRELLSQMQRLPENQRTALALFELGGLSQADIAQAMEVEPARVKTLVHRARVNLTHARAAREASCESIREQLAVARGGQLNSRELRNHVRDCEDCADYALLVRRQRRRFAIVLPVVPMTVAPAIAGLAGGTVAEVGGNVGASAGGAVAEAGGNAGASAGGKSARWRPPPAMVAAMVAGTVGVAAAAVAAVGTGGDGPSDPAPKPAGAQAAPGSGTGAAGAASAATPKSEDPEPRENATTEPAAEPAQAGAAVAAEPALAATPPAPSAPPAAKPEPPPAEPSPAEPPQGAVELPDPGSLIDLPPPQVVPPPVEPPTSGPPPTVPPATGPPATEPPATGTRPCNALPTGQPCHPPVVICHGPPGHCS